MLHLCKYRFLLSRSYTIVRINHGEIYSTGLIRTQGHNQKSHQKEHPADTKTRITSHLPLATSKWSLSISVRPGRPILRPSSMASTDTTPRPPPCSRTMWPSSARTEHSTATPTWPCLSCELEPFSLRNMELRNLFQEISRYGYLSSVVCHLAFP